MTEYLTVEPSPELRTAFAAFALTRDPNVQTVSSGGFLVSLDWYPQVPSELLAGAYVDGFRYDLEHPQPAPADPPKPAAPRARKRSTNSRARKAPQE